MKENENSRSKFNFDSWQSAKLGRNIVANEAQSYKVEPENTRRLFYGS